MRSHIFRVIGVLLIAVSLSTSFQNCGRAGMDGTIDGESVNLSSSIDLKAIFGTDAAKVEAIPFAFDAGFDQITYNSCANPDLAKNNMFFTLRAGAYSNGGVKIAQNFWDYINYYETTTDGAKRFRFAPVNGASELSDNQIKRYLSYSPANYGAQLQAAFRPLGTTQNMVAGVFTASGSPTENRDYFNLGMELTDDRMMDPLVRNKKYFGYFPLVPEENKRLLEMSYAMNGNDVAEGAFRSALMGFNSDIGTAINLMLTYSSGIEKASTTQARTNLPLSDKNAAVLGRRYIFNFSQAYDSTMGAPGAGQPQQVMSRIDEVNLVDNAIDSKWQWDCSRVYRVIRKKDLDANIKLCPSEPIDAAVIPSKVQELEIARRHLPAGFWNVNVTERCIVPKAEYGSCYPSEQIAREVISGSQVTYPTEDFGVEYDPTKPCFNESTAAQASVSSNLKFYYPGQTVPQGTVVPKRCASYITICVRKQAK